MAGDDLARPSAGREVGGGRAEQGGAFRGGQRPQDGLRDEGVRRPGPPHPEIDDARVGQQLQRVGQIRHAHRGQLGDGVEGGLVPEGGGGAGHGGCRRPQPRQPFPDRGDDLARGLLQRGRPEQLLEQEGDATAAPVELLRGQARDLGDRFSLSTYPVDPQHRQRTGGEHPGPAGETVEHVRGGEGLAGALRQQQQSGQLRDAGVETGREEVEQLQGPGVGPVDVVDHEQQRAGLGQALERPAQRVVDLRQAPGRGRLPGLGGRGGEGLGERGGRAVEGAGPGSGTAGERRQPVADHRVREHRRDRGRHGVQDREPGRGRRPARVAQQGRLPDAGLPHDEHRAPRAGGRGAERIVDGGGLLGPLDQLPHG